MRNHTVEFGDRQGKTFRMRIATPSNRNLIKAFADNNVDRHSYQMIGTTGGWSMRGIEVGGNWLAIDKGGIRKNLKIIYRKTPPVFAAIILLCCVAAAQEAVKTLTAEDFYRRGLAEKKDKGCGYAAENFTKAIKLDPRDARFYKERGECAASWSKDESLADFETAIRLKPDYTEAYLERARLYFFEFSGDKTSEYAEKALVDLNKAAELSPKNARVYDLRGKVYFHVFDDREKAFRDFDAAVKLAPGDTDYLMSRAARYRIIKQNEKAAADYTAALKLQPRDHDALYARGLVYLSAGAFQKAITDFSAAIKIKPEYAFIYEHRAEAYRALGKKSLAAADEKKAAELNRRLETNDP